jgi:glycosyltransferase involved in cell wall biosynthesis
MEVSVIPHVSVIIPTYNRSRLLRLATESVLAQTYPNIEIIVVDDGSTDDTSTVVAQCAERGQVTYIKQANQGVAAARNTGIRVASGEYLNFLDHDDLFAPTKIERQVHVLESRPEISLVHCRYDFIDEGGNFLSRVGVLPEEELFRTLVCGCRIWSGAPLLRRQCLDQVGMFDTRLAGVDEWDMWLRIARAGYQFACIQEPLGAYRILPDSAITNVAAMERLVFALMDKVFADPQLPAEVVAVKDRALGMHRRWLSSGYYSAGLWADAQRNLIQAAKLLPDPLGNPEELLEFFCGYALGPRGALDSVKFMNDIFDHLPPSADSLRPYRSQTLGKLYAGLALRTYATGNATDAKSQLATAIALNPSKLEDGDVFADALCDHAMSLPAGARTRYVETVLEDLPPSAQRLEHVRARVLSEVSIRCASEDYRAGHRLLGVKGVVKALRYRPSLLGTRGFVSKLLSSLLGRRPMPTGIRRALNLRRLAR